jgi:RNA polymerase sigma-70 factor (ECF subfamily)
MSDFRDLIQRVFSGESEAAEILVRNYEPEIRRVVRFKFRDPRLRRVVDSTDICQSVFAKFFVSAALGQFEIKSPKELVRLLAKMAVNRVIDQHRKQQSQRAVVSKKQDEYQFGLQGEVVDQAELPQPVVERDELLGMIKNRLTKQERDISRMRHSGKTWQQISEAIGEPAQVLRKRLERACDRIFTDLGIGAS